VPRATWDDAGTRLFQTGVDRGMLYVGTSVAVPWSGLASVTESPTGGDAQEYYLDGRKILSISSSEEFAAKIEAFASPLEFAICAGRVEISPALYVSDQPRQGFGFSYRTLIGNDDLGTDFAYKVHLVYNALAQISDFTHGTVTDKANVSTYSWAVTTTPVVVVGYKPASHFVADSRTVDPLVLAQLESILYGDDSDDPRFPSAQEFLTLLA
jgi:hypothetical protein